jgi:hypothetical protein
MNRSRHVQRQAGKELGQEAGITTGCQSKRSAGFEVGMHRGRHVQRQAGKELGQEAGITTGCQAKRHGGIEEGMHRSKHVQRQAERQSSKSNTVVIVPGIDAHMRAKTKEISYLLVPKFIGNLV